MALTAAFRLSDTLPLNPSNTILSWLSAPLIEAELAAAVVTMFCSSAFSLLDKPAADPEIPAFIASILALAVEVPDPMASASAVSFCLIELASAVRPSLNFLRPRSPAFAIASLKELIPEKSFPAIPATIDDKDLTAVTDAVRLSVSRPETSFA